MDFDWGCYKGNLDWLQERTIYLTVHGSHAYGTSLPTSDIDIRGVCIAPKKYYLGFSEKFEQTVLTDPDLTIFELRKFMYLAADANPNVLELLYTDPEDRIEIKAPMYRLLDNRDLFLSKKAKHTFSGYARSQLRRINLHYRWLKDPPKAPPTRAEFGLPERTVIPADQLMAAQSAIQKQIDKWSFKDLEDIDPATRQAIMDRQNQTLLEITGWAWTEQEEKVWRSAANGIGISTNFIELLDKERRYTAQQRHWASYQEWQKTRNPKRAEIEAKYGFDAKHALHLVRLTKMCREILTLGKVIVKRPDAEELLSIRHGAWSYEKLIEWSDAQDLELTQLAKESKLPNAPDRKKLDDLCVEIVEEFNT
jgi:predicted nucleotidyltransferase